MTVEEEELFQKITNLKRERDLLFVVFEEAKDLIKSGYDGPFMGEEVRGIFHAVNEYDKWKLERRRKEEDHS